MKRRLQLAVLRLIGLLAGTWVLYALLVNWMRVQEAYIAVKLVHLVGITTISDVVPGAMLMTPGSDLPLVGIVTTSCSSAGALMPLVGLALFILPGTPLRRLGGMLTAGFVVVSTNLLRLAIAGALGSTVGEPGLLLFHDWVGTLLTLFSILTGLLIQIAFLLPKNESSKIPMPTRSSMVLRYRA